MDAKNAFTSLNGSTALLNIGRTWPRACRFLFNCYQGDSPLTVPGCKETLYSQEGTTQGDPLAMFYGCAIMPLIQKLKNMTENVQEWYAGDASSFGKLTSLKKWLEILQKEGPAFGYFPEPTKSYLIVNEGYISQAKTLFGPQGVNVVSAHRFLGSIIGSKELKSDYLRVKADEWSQSIQKIAEAAESYPHESLSAFTRSLQNEWGFLSRVLPDCQDGLWNVEE